MSLEAFFAALVGGLVGGVATGLTIILVLRAKGRSWFIDPQLDYLEKQLKEVVIEQAFGQIGKLLERGERLGQLVSRVLEIVHLLRGGIVAPAQTGSAAGAGAADLQLAAAHAIMGTALSRMARFDDAKREFEQALRLDPTNLPALQGLRALDTTVVAGAGAAAQPGSVSIP
jgi:tetratricopeptide (TPR) repeat protein